MPYNIENQVALISGGTSGIGYATAEILLRQGWSVVINGRREMHGEKALVKLRRISSKVRFVAGDVSKLSDCQRIVKETVDRFGPITALVTAAGYYEETLLADVKLLLTRCLEPTSREQFFSAKQPCLIYVSHGGLL